MRDAGVQLPYYYKRNPAKKQDIIQSRPHSKIVWAALRLSYTEKGSTQARPSSHAAMLSAAKLIYGYRGCRFRRLLSLPLLPEVQNRYTFFFGRVVAFNKSLDDARCGGVHHFKAIPHNSKCRYGERGAADAKPKAQIILDAAKVSAASGGSSEPKQGQRSQSARGFCPRSTMRVPQPDIIEHFGNADAVPQLPERCLSRKAGIVRCCLKCKETLHGYNEK